MIGDLFSMVHPRIDGDPAMMEIYMTQWSWALQEFLGYNTMIIFFGDITPWYNTNDIQWSWFFQTPTYTIWLFNIAMEHDHAINR